MNVCVLAIEADATRSAFVVVVTINDAPHQFTLAVEQYATMVGVAGDEQFRAAFRYHPVVARELVRLVGTVYAGQVVTLPRYVQWRLPARWPIGESVIQ